jgi:hypothetical protein
METAVECHSGHTYAERPKAFYWKDTKFKVESIETAWRSPEGMHFRVKTQNGSKFELIYNEASLTWQIK